MNPLLLKTDQTLCYDSAGHAIPCRGSGQDGAQAMGILAATERFEVSGAVARDKVTGAVWTKNANPAEFPLTFEEALSFTADMAASGAHGQRNWQLPPRGVLFSLLSHQQVNPALPEGHPFTNIFLGNYWTADACARIPEQAWIIQLGGGRVTRANKRDAALVWPVSLPENKTTGGGLSGAARFKPDGESVLDTATGLNWSRDADAARGPVAWEQALARVQTLNANAVGGVTDWRLPDIRELESLVDLTAHSPALGGGQLFLNVREAYWSSTTSVYEARYAWTLYFRDGMVGVGFKPDAEFFLWPVRGGA